MANSSVARKQINKYQLIIRATRKYHVGVFKVWSLACMGELDKIVIPGPQPKDSNYISWEGDSAENFHV